MFSKKKIKSFTYVDEGERVRFEKFDHNNAFKYKNRGPIDAHRGPGGGGT
jgi:hypothetical protein